LSVPLVKKEIGSKIEFSSYDGTLSDKVLIDWINKMETYVIMRNLKAQILGSSQVSSLNAMLLFCGIMCSESEFIRGRRKPRVAIRWDPNSRRNL